MELSTDRIFASPEEEELLSKQRELLELEEQLTNLELELQDITITLRRFQVKYLQEIVTRYVQIDRLKAELAEALWRRNPQDSHLRAEAERIRKSAEESAQAFAHSQAETADAMELLSVPPWDKELKNLYRNAAKVLHPDFETDPALKRKKEELMKQLNFAYQRGDAEAMRQILEGWKSSPEAVSGDSVAAELVRTIRKIAQVRKRIALVERELAQAKESSLWKLYLQCQELKAVGRDLLSEMAMELDKEIQELKENLAYVSGK